MEGKPIAIDRHELAKMEELREAFQFLEQVKLELSDQLSVYQEFLLVMKGHATDAKAAIERVKSLFRGNKKLIEGFNKFLPQGHKIKSEAAAEPEDQKRDSADSYSDSPGTLPSTVFLRAGVPTLETVERRRATVMQAPLSEFDIRNPNYARAVEYVKKIKERFKPHSPDVFTGFIHLLRAHHQGSIPVAQVVLQVTQLFANQHDLQDEFVTFLPVDAQQQARETFWMLKHTNQQSNSKQKQQKSDTSNAVASEKGSRRSRKRKAAAVNTDGKNG